MLCFQVVSVAGLLESDNFSSFFSLRTVLTLQVDVKTEVLSYVCLMLAAAAKSLQSCPTLCDPIDSSPPCSPVLGILQARTLEWVAISFSSV